MAEGEVEHEQEYAGAFPELHDFQVLGGSSWALVGFFGGLGLPLRVPQRDLWVFRLWGRVRDLLGLCKDSMTMWLPWAEGPCAHIVYT